MGEERLPGLAILYVQTGTLISMWNMLWIVLQKNNNNKKQHMECSFSKTFAGNILNIKKIIHFMKFYTCILAPLPVQTHPYYSRQI